MQPLTASELDAFLRCAHDIIQKNQLGSLQRLAEPFVRQPLSAALLHFAYQQARSQKRSQEGEENLFDTLERLCASDGQGTAARLFPIQRLSRVVPACDAHEADITHHYFAPILDLLEITKSLR